MNPFQAAGSREPPLPTTLPASRDAAVSCCRKPVQDLADAPSLRGVRTATGPAYELSLPQT